MAVTFRGYSSDDYSDEYVGNIVIPESVIYDDKSYSVTEIGSGAFYGCTKLTSVTIPNSATSIDGNAFYDTEWYNNQSDGLLYLDNWLLGYKRNKPEGELKIVDGTKGIANSAFRNCSELTEITIPNSVTKIGSSTFSGCTKLTEITIPNSVTSIGDNAFYKCSGLTSVTIPNSITSIGDGAFNGCSKLSSVIIPNSVTEIGSSAFSGCTKLTSVTIPNSVTEIGWRTFYGTGWYNNQSDGLLYLDNWLLGYKGNKPEGELKIVDGTKGIANQAFSTCSELTSVIIHNSVTCIGISTFSSCAGLTEITIPNSVTEIGDGAFYGCTGLTEITIPNSVTSIGDNTFYKCI